MQTSKISIMLCNSCILFIVIRILAEQGFESCANELWFLGYQKVFIATLGAFYQFFVSECFAVVLQAVA